MFLDYKTSSTLASAHSLDGQIWRKSGLKCKSRNLLNNPSDLQILIAGAYIILHKPDMTKGDMDVSGFQIVIHLGFSYQFRWSSMEGGKSQMQIKKFVK